MKDFDQSLQDCLFMITTIHRLFAGKLYQVRHEISDTLDTAATDGKKILYNEAFFFSLSVKQQVTLICHELLHILLGHHLRIRGRDFELWNAACDYVNNLILVEMGFEPLDNWLFDPKYKGMSAEDIYALLQGQSQDEQDKQKEQSKESGGSFEEPTNADGSPMDDKDLEEAKEACAKDAQKASDSVKRQINGIKNSTTLDERTKVEKLKEIGAGGETFTERLQDMTASRIDWKDVVRRFLFSNGSSDYNEEVLDLDEMFITNYKFVCPSVISEEFGKVALCLDVSLSLSHEAKAVASEAFYALEEINEHEMLTYWISDRINKKDTITDADQIEIVHGGGTNFDCFFNKELIEEDVPAKAIIFVTDGDVVFKNWIQPEQPVLWILTRANNWFEDNVPFGECVRMWS
jgi:predicted metal-dependent peptidase